MPFQTNNITAVVLFYISIVREFDASATTFHKLAIYVNLHVSTHSNMEIPYELNNHLPNDDAFTKPSQPI